MVLGSYYAYLKPLSSIGSLNSFCWYVSGCLPNKMSYALSSTRHRTSTLRPALLTDAEPRRVSKDNRSKTTSENNVGWKYFMMLSSMATDVPALHPGASEQVLRGYNGMFLKRIAPPTRLVLLHYQQRKGMITSLSRLQLPRTKARVARHRRQWLRYHAWCCYSRFSL
jgi:hypothetical protein